jgi:hypothetical protein
MSNLLAQIILAARDRDIESWTNILFIVVVAAFYVIGSIVKAKANKLGKQKQDQPGRKPPEPTPGAPKALQKTPYRQAQHLVSRTQKAQRRPQEIQPPRRKIARPQPVGRKVAPKVEQAVGLGAIEPLEELKLSPPKPQVQPKFEELPEFTGKTVKKLEGKYSGIPKEILQAKYLSEILLDYSDADSLRTAILHYEILGKPLSLRGQGEHII